MRIAQELRIVVYFVPYCVTETFANGLLPYFHFSTAHETVVENRT